MTIGSLDLLSQDLMSYEGLVSLDLVSQDLMSGGYFHDHWFHGFIV